MPRTVKKEEFAAKRNEILDVAQQLVYNKGYERMTIQDILSNLGMSSGAFYHYFDSKPAVLEALIERMMQEAEQPILPIVHDPNLSALEKLQRFFDTLNRLRGEQKHFLVDLLRVWYTDDNAIVRQKVEAATVERRVPLLTIIVLQGVQEGVFTPFDPDHAGEIVLSLARGMDNSIAKLMLSRRTINEIVATYAAYMDAIERVLGAPSGYLHRFESEAAKTWIAALRDG